MHGFPGDDTVKVYCIEEFAIVTSGRVGIMMAPALVRKWDEQERKVIVKQDRIIAIPFLALGVTHWFTAAYAPTQGLSPVRHTSNWSMTCI